MTREELRQYQAYKREIDQLDKSIERLKKQAEEVPTVAGKVQSSLKDFPYTETHVTVEMQEPKQEDSILRRILIREEMRDRAEHAALEIEEFIADVEDSTDRQILQLAYIEGKTQEEIAGIVNLEQSTVSRRIAALVDD